MKKIKISHIAGVGLIYKKKDPSQIFLEIKDDGFPAKAFRRKLCVIGGNWIGERARLDGNTLGTFRRELDEEITLEKGRISTTELRQLGYYAPNEFYQVGNTDIIPTEEETKRLSELKQVISENCKPFGDYLETIPQEVLDKADPENKKEGFVVIASYWCIALENNNWNQLVQLQRKFGNLSNESFTIITSLEDIIETKTHTAFGHDWALRDFFFRQGFQIAKRFPMMKGISGKRLGNPLPTYEEYLVRYEVAKNPL